MCELLVGLPDVDVLAVVDHVDGPLEVHVECRDIERACLGCGRAGWVKQRTRISLTDLPCFGRSTELVWHKLRLACPNEVCPMQSWTLEDHRIAAPRMALIDRAVAGSRWRFAASDAP